MLNLVNLLFATTSRCSETPGTRIAIVAPHYFVYRSQLDRPELETRNIKSFLVK